VGGIGSPYSLKLRAVLRFRRLPFVWTLSDNSNREKYMVPNKPKLLPMLCFPDGSIRNDTTPLIMELEKKFSGRNVFPKDQGLAFVTLLLEDFADEWVVKAMYAGRWWLPQDQDFAEQFIGTTLALPFKKNNKTASLFREFRNRQVGRLSFVGCTANNMPMIKETESIILKALETHWNDGHEFLLGTRPSVADFAFYGQLAQMAIDTTPMLAMRHDAITTYTWLQHIDDLSGIEVQEDGFLDWTQNKLPEGVMKLLQLCCEVYLPYLAATEKAILEKKKEFHFKWKGFQYQGTPFIYQLKCLQGLRQALKQIDSTSRDRVQQLIEPLYPNAWLTLTSAPNLNSNL